MTKPLRYVLIGVGGWGEHWRTEVLPRLKQIGLAVAAAAVDMNSGVLPQAKADLHLGDDQLYTDAATAVEATRPDFIIIVVPPGHHEAMVDLAIRHQCHILS